MLSYVIIGASSGIGKQLALQLSAGGNRVVGTYFKTPPQQLPQEIVMHPLNVLEENPDFSFLPEKVDGLVYCPGSINLKPFARITPTDFINDYALQVVGAVKVLQATLPKLKQAEQARIVLFSTVAVQLGLNFHAQVASSKGAIEGLTRSLAAEFSPKIRVNCIAPSLTDTPLAAALLSSDEKKEANAQRHPLKKIGSSADIANMAEFLLSEKAAWITGQIFHVDGGMGSLKV